MDNNYKYIKCVSSGAFSMCGLYKKNNKYYAIKTSIDSGEYDGISCNELRELLCILILKNHENIIDISEIFINLNSNLNLVYKYYPETLQSYIYRTSSAERLHHIHDFISQMLSSLNYFYKNNIIHTDLKPNNILIYFNNDKLNIKIIDFGSSYIEGLTSKYTIVTTYTHRAPEIFSYDTNYDFKIDIWSLGVLIYEFLTDNTILDISKHNSSDDIDKLKDIYKFSSEFQSIDIDTRFKLFLSKMFQVDPNKRCDINNLILFYESLFLKKVKIYDSLNLDYTNSTFNLELHTLNKYISDRMFNVNLTNLNYGYYILSKLEHLTDKDYVTIWYLNYQFAHKDVEYYLSDFIYIFNSYYKKIFNKMDIHNNCFDILYMIDFNLF